MIARLTGLAALLVLLFCGTASAAGPTWHTALVATDNIDLNAASCSTPTLCIAVGDTGLAAVEDGSYQYLTVADQDPEYASLNAISCVAGARFCMAVDSRGSAVRWVDGEFGPRETIDSPYVLESVSCPTTTFCKAVDDFGRVLTYAGGTWSASPVQLPGTIAQGTPRLSCASVTFCVAVAQTGAGIVYYKFGGVTWSASATSVGTQTDEAPRSLVCTTTSFCLVTSNKGSAARFDGAFTWTVKQVVQTVRVPLQAGCAGTVCRAIDQNVKGYSTTDGVTWTAGTDLHASTQLSIPSSVSCLTADLCVATSGDLTTAFANSIIPTTKPVVSGAGAVGQTLTVTHPALEETRAWFGTIWWRCDNPGSTCTRIPDVNGPTYTLTAADAGKYIEARDDTGIGLDEEGSKFSGNMNFVSKPVQVAAPAAVVPAAGALVTAPSSPAQPSPPVSSPAPAPVTGAAGAKLSGKIKVSATAATVPVTCATACSGKATLSKVGSAKFTIAAGRTKRLTIKLSQAVRRQLRGHHKLKVTLTITVKSGSTVTQKVTLGG